MHTISHSPRSNQRRSVSITLVFLFACFALMFYSSASSVTRTPNISTKAVSLAPAQGQQVPTTCPTCAPPRTQVIYAPLIDVADAASSEIVLNCRSADDMDLTPTFYTIEGLAIGGGLIHLRPDEMSVVEIKCSIP